MNTMQDQSIVDVLNAPGMAVGRIESEIAQDFLTTTEKIRCKTKDDARSTMYMVRQVGLDAFVRGAVLTVIAEPWQLGLVEQVKILAGVAA
jgi:hypothetical protein